MQSDQKKKIEGVKDCPVILLFILLGAMYQCINIFQPNLLQKRLKN